MGWTDYASYAIPVYGQYKAGKKILGAAGDFLEDQSRLNNPYSETNREGWNLPGADDMGAARQQYMEQWAGRQAPTADGAQIDPYQQSGQSRFAGQQGDLAEQLRRRASGEESLSQLQLREATDRNLAQQQALAQSARPGQGGLAARQAAQQQAMMSSGLAGQQALAGIQERQGAQGMLGNVLGQARGQDIAQSQFNAAQQNQRALEQARLGQQAGQFNVNTQMQQQGLNQQAISDMMQQWLQQAQAQQAGGVGYEQDQTRRFLGALGVPSPLEQGLSGLQGLLGLAGMAG